jgi:hypothetical protein
VCLSAQALACKVVIKLEERLADPKYVDARAFITPAVIAKAKRGELKVVEFEQICRSMETANVFHTEVAAAAGATASAFLGASLSGPTSGGGGSTRGRQLGKGGTTGAAAGGGGGNVHNFAEPNNYRFCGEGPNFDGGAGNLVAGGNVYVSLVCRF